MADLRTDYQDDVLDASENTARVYDLVDSDGNVVLAGVHLEDKTVYTTEGDDYGAADINEQNGKINELSADLTELTLLWSNPNSTTSFTNQNIVLSDAIENYKEVIIVCRIFTDSTIASVCHHGIVGVTPYIALQQNYGLSGFRPVRFRGGTDAVFGDYTHQTAWGSATVTENRVCIPLAIYGKKYY